MNIFSYLLSSVSSPFLGAVSATCQINGEIVACPDISGALVGFIFGIWAIFIALAVLMLIANWKIYAKAGKPGWAAIVPVYNIVVLLEIVKKPVWWIFLFFIPFVNLIMAIIVMHNLAKSFSKDVGFTIGLIFLPFIFYPILGFGKATYINQ